MRPRPATSGRPLWTRTRSPATDESSRRFVALEVGRFALAGVIALLIVGLATAIASRRVGEREAIANARTTTVSKAQGLVAPALTDGVLNGTPSAIGAVDAVVRRDVLDGSLVRVKLWNEDGTIVYSDEPRLVGTRYTLGADEKAALASGKIEAEVSDLSKPENQYERPQGKLLEVYLPVETPSGKPLLFEAYYRYGLVSRNGSQLWRSFAPIALGALIALELVQIPLAYSLARRLRQRSARTGVAAAPSARSLRRGAPAHRERPPRRRRAGSCGCRVRAVGPNAQFHAGRARSRCHRELGVDGPGEHPRVAVARRRHLPARLR